MKVLFCGGGTAGHVMPAIAMAEILMREKYKIEVAFVGRSGGNENHSIIKEGYKLYTVDVLGLSRSISFKNIKAIIKLIKSGRIAKKIISEFNPDIVIGTGGYVCYPIIKMAQRMGIPTLLHESNVYPGLVTRMLAKKCDRVLLNSEGTRKYLKTGCKTLVIGNPLRVDFSSIRRDDARKKLGIGKNDFFIISFGGSLGSDVMNEKLIEVMRKHSRAKKDIVHIHATGISRYSEVKNSYPQLCTGLGGCRILPYIDGMPTYLKAADLVICRSGAMTLSELAKVGVAAVLIPSPNVTENHQYKNAKYIADNDAAIMIEESNLNFQALVSAIESIRTDLKKRNELATKIKSFSRNDTDKLLIKTVDEMI